MCQCSPHCALLNFYSQLWCSGGGFGGGLEQKYTMPFKPHWAEVGSLHHTRESNWAGRKTSLLHAARASRCWASDVESGRGRGGKGWQKGAWQKWHSGLQAQAGRWKEGRAAQARLQHPHSQSPPAAAPREQATETCGHKAQHQPWCHQTPCGKEHQEGFTWHK